MEKREEGEVEGFLSRPKRGENLDRRSIAGSKRIGGPDLIQYL